MEVESLLPLFWCGLLRSVFLFDLLTVAALEPSEAYLALYFSELFGILFCQGDAGVLYILTILDIQ